MEEEMEEPEEQGEVEDGAAEDGEPAILICASVADSERLGMHMDGLVVMSCSRCGQDVFVAPSGRRFLSERPDAVAYCNFCAELKLLVEEAKGETPNVSQLPESTEEILSYFKSRLNERRQKLMAEMDGDIDFVLQENDDGSFNVKIHPEAVKEWQEKMPGFPPMDELFMKVQLGECSICGKDVASDKEGIGAIDPEYIDLATGEVHGKVICEECLTKGE